MSKERLRYFQNLAVILSHEPTGEALNELLDEIERLKALLDDRNSRR